MDKRVNVLETVTVPPAHHARIRHAGLAVEDLAEVPLLPPHLAEVIAPSAGADLQAAVIAAAAATAQAAVE